MGAALVMKKRLEELIATGVKNGYVLYDEIDALLPNDIRTDPKSIDRPRK
jgi:hypothetical protein